MQREQNARRGKGNSLVAQWTKIATVVCTYWLAENIFPVRCIFFHDWLLRYRFISISMVFLNKYLLSSKSLKVILSALFSCFNPPLPPSSLQLDAPLFITLSQCTVAVLVFLCLSVSSKQYEFITFPSLEFSVQTALKVSGNTNLSNPLSPTSSCIIRSSFCRCCHCP